jgi:hypothetical protein
MEEAAEARMRVDTHVRAATEMRIGGLCGIVYERQSMVSATSALSYEMHQTVCHAVPGLYAAILRQISNARIVLSRTVVAMPGMQAGFEEEAAAFLRLASTIPDVPGDEVETRMRIESRTQLNVEARYLWGETKAEARRVHGALNDAIRQLASFHALLQYSTHGDTAADHELLCGNVSQLGISLTELRNVVMKVSTTLEEQNADVDFISKSFQGL